VRGYRKDLAYIHDAGFSDYALGAAPGLLRILKKNAIARGLVIDLGCGSGRWAHELNCAGYNVLGIDQSPEMIRLARRVAPRAKFRVGSLWSAALSPCDAITSIGECLNYCFDRASHTGQLAKLFTKAFHALRPGGGLIFDFAGLDRKPRGKARKHTSAGPDWAVVARTTALGPDGIRRHIVAQRRVGKRFRRSVETHDLRLFRVREIRKELNRCGFRARSVRGYGRFRFPRGIHGVIAVKPKARRS
jgi:SAM-dependent methyltransferase